MYFLDTDESIEYCVVTKNAHELVVVFLSHGFNINRAFFSS